MKSKSIFNQKATDKNERSFHFTFVKYSNFALSIFEIPKMYIVALISPCFDRNSCLVCIVVRSNSYFVEIMLGLYPFQFEACLTWIVVGTSHVLALVIFSAVWEQVIFDTLWFESIFTSTSSFSFSRV